MRKFIFIGLVLAFGLTKAQHYKTYKMRPDPKPSELREGEDKYAAIGISEIAIVEYVETGTGEMKLFETSHTITKVINEDGIQRFNRVYIPMYGVDKIVNIEARTINGKGEIEELNKRNIKEVENVEEYGDFKIFAIEGLERGSDVEVLYTLEKGYTPFGSKIIQEDYPIRSANFFFIFGQSNGRAKAYGENVKMMDQTFNGRKAKRLMLDDIPVMTEEEYATSMANRISVSYQCLPSFNAMSNHQLWDRIIKNVTSDFFSQAKHPTVYRDLLKAEGIETKDEFWKVAWIEDFIKSNFNIVQSNNDQLRNIQYIMSKRTTSEAGIMQVYAQYFNILGVNYEVVITANRYRQYFDPDFFTPRAIQDFLIYVPSLKMYIAPNRQDYRIGEAPYQMLGANAAFVNAKTGNHRFSKIQQLDENFSRVVRFTDVSFGDDVSKVYIDQKHEYYGHWGQINRASYQLSTEEGRREFEDFLTASGIEDKEALNLEIGNSDFFQAEYNTPFEVFSKISTESLIEDAGDGYVFLAGLIIGTQSELYQEEERINPVVMNFPNQYNYTITIDIPEGYSVEGLESLDLYKELKTKEGIICKFDSSYELVDGDIVIKIEEFYRSSFMDKSMYEGFRNVINAASDFNKASILLVPES